MLVPGHFYHLCGAEQPLQEEVILMGEKDCDILAAHATWLFVQRDGITLCSLPKEFDPAVTVRELRKDDLPAYLYLHQYPGMERVLKGIHPWAIA